MPTRDPVKRQAQNRRAYENRKMRNQDQAQTEDHNMLDANYW